MSLPLTDLSFWIKISGATLLVYGLIALAFVRRARDEDRAAMHLLLSGSSLAMGSLVFALGFAAVLAGPAGA